ncbi:hypothetical protein COM13_19720 [Bacillus pseudomycoides]|uniref:hypothetical protein n=1 Tax=Bacillus TaxID=1386 RepID=UPI000BEE318F|nr:MULTISPECIES: hypothetical protein [Bacillus]MCX2824684.1 hypothetical protein [Bacillus sp. DHT2]MDR4915582.1 hypothetical protein [Bacillus pseudomycoides]PDX98138.1 hypothetical protein COO07_23570 [Bacillus pseudomycoides]PEK82613.1 hypothetical protein CN597_02610 [Bacillus pseudomycoides]PEN07521.1 hypothetical protein CN640_17230 [Bacillus pseudomycoides]
MDFEKHLRDELQRKSEVMEPSSNLRKRVKSSFDTYYQENEKGRRSMKKRLLVGLIAAAVLIPTGTFVGPTLVSKVIGTPEEAKEQFGAVEEEYKEFNEIFEIASQLFTKEEFEKFSKLWKESQALNKKAIVVDGERTSRSTARLSKEELKRYDEVNEKLRPYEEKIYGKFKYTINEAQKLVNFPIKYPAYIPKNYRLYEEEARAEITSGKPKPFIMLTYVKGELSSKSGSFEDVVQIKQSEIFEVKKTPHEQNSDDFDEQPFDRLSNYTIDGCRVTLGEYKFGNIIGMRIIVPAKNDRSEYRIFVTDSKLSKKELEKVLFSMVK